MKISVIIPAYNEEAHIVKNIETVYDTIEGLDYEPEIIMVDDCSDDDTFLLVYNRCSNVTVFRKTVHQGKGAAVKTGWKFATGEYVVVMDADLQIQPKEIEVFFKQMQHFDADVVVGNKRHPYSNVQYPLLRKIVSEGYNLFVRLLFGVQLRDTQCGFKLFKKSVLDKVMAKVLCKAFAFDLELLVALKANNFRVADAPVYVTKPMGKGSVNANSILNTAKDTLAVWWRRSNGWYEKGGV